MGLVNDLVTEVIDSSSELSQALRKAKLLGFELRSEELRIWSEAELTGYAPEDQLPPYRVFKGMNFGDFAGMGGSRATGVPIRLSAVPKEWREELSRLELRQGIAAVQEMFKSEGYREQWSADRIASVSGKIYDSMNMVSAWKEIPRTNLVLVLDAVRNRLLNFLLELREWHPEVDAADVDLRSIPEDDVRVSVINHIYGGHNVLASGGTVHQQVQQAVKPGDLTSLLSALREASLPEELISELSEAINKDEPVRAGGIGPRVSSWLAKVGEKVATSAAGGFAAQAILQYYGLAGT